VFMHCKKEVPIFMQFLNSIEQQETNINARGGIPISSMHVYGFPWLTVITSRV
jgi:hypothetical protein